MERKRTNRTFKGRRRESGFVSGSVKPNSISYPKRFGGKQEKKNDGDHTRMSEYKKETMKKKRETGELYYDRQAGSAFKKKKKTGRRGGRGI